MGDFFADQTSTAEVSFPEDDVVVTLRKYITAGMREELRNQMVKVNLQESAGTNGAQGQVVEREARLEVGDFFMLSKMILRVQVPEGTMPPHVPVSKNWLGALKPEAVRKLIDEVNEHNPLVEEEAAEGWELPQGA